MKEFNSTVDLSSFCIYRVKLPSLEEFLDTFKNYDVEYSRNNGNSTVVSGKCPMFVFVTDLMSKEFYVFHDSFKDKRFFRILNNILPAINTERQMRISRVYIGKEGTGSHIHNHTVAVNYLINGQKVWIIFPNTRRNMIFLKRHNFEYGCIKEEPLKWYTRHRDFLLNNLEDPKEIFQTTGDVIVIPDGYYHGVYNLSEVCGVTYSWF